MNINQNCLFIIFRFFIFFMGGSNKTKYFDHLSKTNFLFRFVELSHLFSSLFFNIVSTILQHGRVNYSLYKNNWSELSTPKLKKPVLSSSDYHTSSASNSKRTSISSRLDNKHITNNQNKNNISNTYDVHSCVTPRKQNYSFQATSTTTHLTPLNATLSIAYFKLHTTTELHPAGKSYFFSRLTVNVLMLPSVSNIG